MDRNEAFLRQQISYCTDYYRQVRPGSRSAAEVVADQQSFRSELAALLRRQRKASPPSMGAMTPTQPT